MPKVVGKVEMKPLSGVKPNGWNPNQMTAFEKESLKTGLLKDGWLISQALLIWGSDEKGVKKDLIIDGEHRWYAATELRFGDGPMVYLENLPEAEAKALTIKMDAKRGKFNGDRLGELLRDIQFDLGAEIDLSLGVGIPEEDLMKMLSFEPEVLQPSLDSDDRQPVESSPQGPPPAMQQGHVSLVQLFFSKDQRTEFDDAAKRIAERTGAKNISETVLAAVKQAAT